MGDKTVIRNFAPPHERHSPNPFRPIDTLHRLDLLTQQILQHTDLLTVSTGSWESNCRDQLCTCGTITTHVSTCEDYPRSALCLVLRRLPSVLSCVTPSRFSSCRRRDKSRPFKMSNQLQASSGRGTHTATITLRPTTLQTQSLRHQVEQTIGMDQHWIARPEYQRRAPYPRIRSERPPVCELGKLQDGMTQNSSFGTEPILTWGSLKPLLPRGHEVHNRDSRQQQAYATHSKGNLLR